MYFFKFINPLKLSGDYIHDLFYQSVTLFCIYESYMILSVNSDHFLEQH
jgi:hypothetical protein